MTDLDDDVQSQATSESSTPRMDGRTLATGRWEDGASSVTCPSVCPSAETSEKMSDTHEREKKKSRFELQPQHVAWFYISTF